MVDKVTAPNELAQLQSLLSLAGAGGTVTRTTPTNTAPLQGVLSSLQGVDYNAMLQGIFQQAAGQIPGMQAAYGRAVGARSSGNAPMQAALQELLKQTALAGQQQVAQQQQRNLETQAQVAGNLSGKQQTVGQKSQLGQAAALIGLLQGATKLGGYKTVQEMLGAVSGSGANNQAPSVVSSIAPGDLTLPQNMPFADSPYANYGGASYTPGADMFANFGGTAQDSAPVYDTSYYTPSQSYDVPTYDYGNMTNIVPEFNVADYAVTPEPAYDMSPANFSEFDAMNYF